MKKISEYIKNNKAEVISVGLIIILAIFFRIVALLNMGEPWSDELFSWTMAYHDSIMKAIKYSYNYDVHVPLYFVLLNIWIRIFGDGAIPMRWLSFLLTLPLVPFGYYAAKRLFNKTAAFYAAIFLAINTFCIYYCVEIRMYALNLILSLMSAYFFVRYVEDFKKRDSIGYIISVSLLMYNFAMTPLLAFCYLVVGFIYVLIYKKEFLKKFLASQGIAFVICIPALIWTLHMSDVMHHTLFYYPKDILLFHKDTIIEMIQDMYTLEPPPIATGFFDAVKLLDKLKNPLYLVSVFLPCILVAFGYLKAMISKNKRFYLFFLPSLIFFAVLIIGSYYKLACVQPRYATMVMPVFAIAFCFGFSDFKNKMASWILYITFFILIIINPICNEKTVFNVNRPEINDISTIIRYNVKLQKDDLLLFPFAGNTYMYYIRHKNYIPFSIDNFLVAGEKRTGKMYFGENFDKITRDSVKDLLYEEIKRDVAHKPFEDTLYNQYIKPMKKGQRFVYVVAIKGFVVPLTHRDRDSLTPENLRTFSMSEYLYSKVHRDALLILQKYLKEARVVDVNDTLVFIFEKE